MERRLFNKMFAGSLVAAVPLARQAPAESASDGPPYKITLSLGQNSAGECIALDPLELKVRKRQSRVFELAADPTNAKPISISYPNDPNEIFELCPKAPFDLDPKGPPKVFVVNRHLGIKKRGTFINDDPAYARTFTLGHPPAGNCHDGDHGEIHIEC